MTTRREILTGAGVAGAFGIAGASGIAHAQGIDTPSAPFPSKFYADGRVRPFKGNTILCHLPQQGASAGPFNALLDIYREAPRHGFYRRVSLLPPSSYHMTIFSTATDQGRKLGLWPSSVPIDAPIEQCNAAVGDLLRSFKLHLKLPIRMRWSTDVAELDDAPLTMRLVPVDASEERRLRRLRNRIADAVGVRGPDHDAYRFHITMGYIFEWLNDSEKAEYREALSAWRERLIAVAPVITLGAPEYCTFKDMFAFDRKMYLR